MDVKLNETVNTIPTIGVNVETVSPVKGVTVTVFDVRGQERIRCLWRRYYENSKGLLFILDSADESRMSEAKEELFGIIKDSNMDGVPVVVVANEQDMPGALSVADVTEKLGLREMRDRKWYVQGACAVDGSGIYEAMNEMAKLAKEFNK